MDQHKLRTLVFEKTGVKLGIDDPVFALVALNEAVLEEAVERHIAAIDAASLELAQQARLAGGLPAVHEGSSKAAVLDASNEAASAATGGTAAANAAGHGAAAPHASSHASAHGAAHAAQAATAPEPPAPYAPSPASGAVKPIATQSAAISPRELRLLAAAAGIAVLSALIVLGGQAVFQKPPPAPVLQARSLTPEQTQALQRAEKLEQAIQKLDPKVRAQLQAELQK